MKTTTTSKATSKPTTNLVAGHFREDSKLASMFNLLKDGKARTPEAIAKATGTKKVANVSGWKYTDLQRVGKASGLFTMTKVDGKIQMTMKQPRKATSKSTKPAKQAEAAATA